MSLRPLATAMIMVLIAAPAHAELIIDQQDGRQPMVVSDAAIARSLAAPTQSGIPSNLYLGGSQDPSGIGYQAIDPAKVAVPQANTMRAQVFDSPRPSLGSARVFETGSARPVNADAPVKGWADNVPLELALQQVVPQGWSVSAAPSVRGQLPSLVSWSGDRPWVSVLSSMVARLPVSARVDWDSRQVLLFDNSAPIPSSLVIPGAVVVKGPSAAPGGSYARSPAPAPMRQAPPLATVLVQPAPTVHAQVPCCTSTQTATATVFQSAPASQRWLIDPRLTLRENVEAWTKQAGWNSVVWEAADYPMVAPAQFEGNFSSPEGPLASLIQAYSDSDQPLKVRLLTQDKVVHVSNRNYTPTVVEPSSPRSVSPSSFDH